MQRPRTELSTDERGATSLLAIPLSVLVVASLWQLNMVGDAIADRERLQNAADGAALESARVHARGMNAAVALNVLHERLGLHWAASQTRACAAVGGGMARAAQSIRGLLPACVGGAVAVGLAARVDRALMSLIETQRAVAQAAPVLANALASAHAAQASARGRGTRSVLAISYAGLPVAADRWLRVDRERSWLLAYDVREPALPRLGTPARHGVRSGIVASLPLEAASSSPSPHGSAAARSNASGPARIWRPAADGNVILQNWAVARDESRVGSLAALALGSPVGLVPVPAERVALAQAEYYFPCPASRTDWRACARQAAVIPDWSARMRRVRVPVPAQDRALGRRVWAAFRDSLPSIANAARGFGVDGAVVRGFEADLAALFASSHAAALCTQGACR